MICKTERRKKWPKLTILTCRADSAQTLSSATPRLMTSNCVVPCTSASSMLTDNGWSVVGDFHKQNKQVFSYYKTLVFKQLNTFASPALAWNAVQRCSFVHYHQSFSYVNIPVANISENFIPEHGDLGPHLNVCQPVRWLSRKREQFSVPRFH